MLRAEHKAIFHLYDYLAGAAVTESREAFTEALSRLLENPPEPPLHGISRESFKSWYVHHVKELLSRHTGQRG